jgi:hypothetical protein
MEDKTCLVFVDGKALLNPAALLTCQWNGAEYQYTLCSKDYVA